MNRLKELFTQKKNGVLNIYCTAGYPRLEDTLPVMRSLQEYGADIIELGIPYSDPLADGPVIQMSSARALTNGMSIQVLFNQLQGFRRHIHIPVILMGYMNPVLQYGFEQFCSNAASAGIDGLILPDLPEYEYETAYGAVIKKYGLDFIFLVTPETSEQRVRKLDALSSGFLYAVSSSSVTGSDKDMAAVEGYLKKLKGYNLKNPILAGFGISDKQRFDMVCRHVNGGIIGSAYITALNHSVHIPEATKGFLRRIIS